jgi:hypothetical protein
MGIARPRIAVAGLNPHAGEGGLFGREDLDVIAQAVARACAEGIDVTGPYPGDTGVHAGAPRPPRHPPRSKPGYLKCSQRLDRRASRCALCHAGRGAAAARWCSGCSVLASLVLRCGCAAFLGAARAPVVPPRSPSGTPIPREGDLWGIFKRWAGRPAHCRVARTITADDVRQSRCRAASSTASPTTRCARAVARCYEHLVQALVEAHISTRAIAQPACWPKWWPPNVLTINRCIARKASVTALAFNCHARHHRHIAEEHRWLMLHSRRSFQFVYSNLERKPYPQLGTHLRL